MPFELWQFKQQNSADTQTDKLSTVPSAHTDERKASFTQELMEISIEMLVCEDITSCTDLACRRVVNQIAIFCHSSV